MWNAYGLFCDFFIKEMREFVSASLFIPHEGITGKCPSINQEGPHQDVTMLAL